MKSPRRLSKADLNLPCKEMAIFLLGKLLVRKLESGSVLKGRIVETESYLGGEDKASNTYNGRQTAANEPLYLPAGTAFVYMTYGMYFCFNISSTEPGAGVLLRALEPLQGVELMKKLRTKKNKGSLKDTDLCNGPSKLCMAMNISKDKCNKLDITESESLWLEDDGEAVEKPQIVSSSRIGINSSAGEWAKTPLRFYVVSSPHVSKRDKKAEDALTT
ncbi:DNA-3-methyladenine glycosylase-like [Zophobas morio]|uniref:DNA-3-methyladenine glycosylase-like n=1 Tax=Zophobas morio TaxID=2755281 RepID=UPI003083E23D